MRLLDRYLLRELAVPLGYCLAGFGVFWISSDLFEQMDEFQRLGLGAGQVAAYYAARAPDFLWIIVPVALLLALLYALTSLSRHHELTAIRAAGVGVWRLAAPYLAAGFALSATLLAINEVWAPASAARARRILQGGREGVQQNLNFQNAVAGRIWRVGEYDSQRRAMTRVRVDWNLPNGSARKLIAEAAAFTNGSWLFREVTELWQESPGGVMLTRETNQLVVAAFTETPRQIDTEIKISGLRTLRGSSRMQLSYLELREYLRWHPTLRKEETALLQTLMHSRLAMPWTCLVVVLIALPFGAVSSRRSAVVGVASSLVICFAYYAVRELSLVLGAGGYLAPLAAAWTPNGVFAALGVWLTARR